MPAPALSVPVRANLDAFKRQMEETSSLAKTAARKAAQHFLDANKELAGGAASAAFSGMAADALKLTGRIALVVGGAKLMADAIGAARQQLADMVELQNKSQNVGVSSSFFQKVSAETKKLQVDASDLEGALSHAFNATKDKAPIDLGQWETGEERITEVEKALRVYNATVANGKLDGLVLFRDADTQEKKIEAVLKAMIQLENIGQKAAALDLGERMFGTAFVDRIRQGRTSAESLLSTIQKASGDADGIFPDALVQRAKEMDDQLKIAHQRLSTALKTSWDDLADGLLTMKGYWATIVDLIARAAELANSIKIPGYSTASLDDKIKEYQQVKDTLDGNGSGIYGAIRLPGLSIPGVGKVFDSSEDKMRARLEELQKDIAASSKGDQFGPFLPSQSRGTGEEPKRKQTGGNDADRFDTSVETIEKRTAALQGEATALDLGAAAREKARIEAQLMTVAMQANAAAGMGANVVTQEQRKVIDETATAYAAAAEAIQKAKVASQIDFDRKTAFLSSEDVAIAQKLRGLYGNDVPAALASSEAAAMRLNDAMKQVGQALESDLSNGLYNILSGTTSVQDGFRQMAASILQDLTKIAIKMAIVRPLMAGLGGFFGFADGGFVDPGSASNPLPGLSASDYEFATGGFTGVGGKYQPAGIVHKGEVVWSQSDVARAGGVGVVEAMRKGYRGYADGGTVEMPRSAGTSPSTSSDSQPSMQFTYAPKIDMRGASPQAVAQLAAQQARMQRDWEKNTQAAFLKMRQNNPGAFR